MIVPSARSKVWGESHGRSEEKASRKKCNVTKMVAFFLLASSTFVENGATTIMDRKHNEGSASEGLPSSTDFLSHMYA